MRIFLARFSLLCCLIGLAGCDHSRPSKAVLDQAINATLPPYLLAAGQEYQFSPLKEVLGTTLPAGTYQVDIRTTVKTREPLYSMVSFDLPRKHLVFSPAVQAELVQLQTLAEWSDQSPGRSPSARATPARPTLSPFLVSGAKAGEEKILWVKVVAEPRGKEWEVTVVEGEPQEAFAGTQPRSAFPADASIHDSPAQTQNVAEVKAAFAADQKRQEILKTLEPELAALEKSKETLNQRYHDECVAQLQAVEAERISLDHGSDDQIRQINQATSGLRDNYKARDEQVAEERKGYQVLREALNKKRRLVEVRLSQVGQRVEDEISVKIHALKKQHGIDDL